MRFGYALKKRTKILAIILIILFSAAVWLLVSRSSSDEIIGQTLEIQIGNVESVVTAQGTLEPKEYVDVGAQVSGRVETLHAEIGDDVKQGDLIAEIDPDVYESKVKADEASLKTLEAQKTEQQALVRQAKQKFERNQLLFTDKAVSKEALEDAQTNLEVAQSNVKSLDAQIEQAQSTLEGDKTNLSYTKIYAPMSGTIVSQSVQEGQTINAAQSAPVIVQVANLNTMTVKAQVAEADIMKLTPGMTMYFTTLGSQNRRWEGTIRQILPSPEIINDVVLYNVLVDVDNKDRQLMNGMTTQMFFVLGKAEQIPVVPVSVLTKRQPSSDTKDGQAYEVQVLSGRDTENRTVIVGLSDRSNAVILEGLTPGERILQPVAMAPAKTSGTNRPSRPPGMGGL